MSTLREELEKYKSRQQEIVDEAAIAWVQDNIILISEKLNRSAITRLTNSIMRFDEKFGPFKDKLPAIQSVIDDAETGLQMVVTGKTSDSRATDMLRNLSMVYSILSEFFSGDLPALLRTPIFRAAKETPDVRLDSISAPKHDPSSIASAIANALRPSKDELRMLGKIYKNIPMPNLKVEDIAKQLLSLSYSELQGLSEVGKIPMVAVPSDLSPDGSAAVEAAPKFEASGVTEMSLTPSTPVAEVQKKTEGEEVLEEAGGTADLASINKALSDLDNIFGKSPDLKSSPLYGALSNLRREAQKVAAGNAQGRISSLLSGTGGIGALVKDPSGRVLAQAQMAVDMFRKLAGVWPKVSNLFTDENFDAEEQKQLSGIISKELKGGIFDQLKTTFGVAPFAGLSVPDVVQAVNTIAQKRAETDPSGDGPGQEQSTDTAQQAVAGQPRRTSSLNEGVEDLKKFFSDLNTGFKPQSSSLDRMMSGGRGLQGKGVGTAGAQQPQTTGHTVPSAQGAAPGQPAPTQATQGTGPVSADTPPGAQGAQSNFVRLLPQATDAQLKAITAVTGVEEDKLRKLITFSGIRVTVHPDYLKIK